MPREKLKNTGKLILKITLTLAAVYIVVDNIELGELWQQIKRINIFYFILALIVFIFSKIIEALRVNNFYRLIHIQLSEWQNVRLYFLGLFYNIFLPGGISGDGYKVYWLKKKKNAHLQRTIWATLINRLNGFLGILILLVIAAALIPKDYPYKSYILLLVPILYLLFYLGLKIFFRNFVSILPKVTVQSVLIQVLQVICVLVLLIGLGSNEHFINYIFIFLASSIAFVIPVTLGGFGSREVVFVFAANYLNIDVNVAIAMSLMVYFIRMVASFMGVYFLLYPDRILNWESPFFQKVRAIIKP